MRVLLTGALSAQVTDMIPRFQREGHSVSLLGEWMPSRGDVTDVSCYRMNPSEKYAQRMVEVARFDVIVFLYSCRSESMGQSAVERGAMLDALLELTTTAQRAGLKHFILVTDRRVFGVGQKGLENERPVPDTTIGVINSAAEDCINHCSQSDFQSLVIRLNSVYSHDDKECLLGELMRHVDDHEAYMMPYPEDEACSFLRAEDLADFICFSINRGLSGTVHLTDGAHCTYGDVVERITAERPKLKVSWPVKAASGVELKSEQAGKLGWQPSHRWQNELALIAPERDGQPENLKSVLRRYSRRIAPIAGIVLPAAALHFLSAVCSESMFIWFYCAWLLYIAAVSVIDGIKIGIIAVALACVSLLIDHSSLAGAFGELSKAAQALLPIASYLAVGVIFGLIHEIRGRNMKKTHREKERLEEEEKLLDIAWKHADEEMNRLEKQVQSASDSYGRIYGIARELDSLQPEQVLLSTLGVIEDVLQSDRVAIYYCKKNDAYARLVINTRGMWMPKSLVLAETPGIAEAFERGETYSSNNGAPAFAVPICFDGSYVAMIALWDKPDKSQDPYYQNLFSITCGLVESALARAMHHLRYASDVYVTNTHFLSSKYLLSACRSFENMKQQGRGDYLMLRITGEDVPSLIELDRRLGNATRSTDICGCLDDGSVVALLPQADESQISGIAVRFAKQSLLCSAIKVGDVLAE